MKERIYELGKRTGLYELCRRRGSGTLRILGYHGIWHSEAPRFGYTLFMRPETFAARMRALAALDVNVLSLDEALRLQDEGSLPPDSVAITIDDGFYGTYEWMLPELEQQGFPATVYVTTYFADTDRPIIPLLLRYIVHNSVVAQLTELPEPLAEINTMPLSTNAERESAAATLARAVALLQKPVQVGACRSIAERLGVELDPVYSTKQFELMSADQIRDAASRGFDIQLHTHRHRTTFEGRSTLADEIADNRAMLEPLAGRALCHFCYPSGVHEEADFPRLRAAGVCSATTCLPGTNRASTNRLALRRILDAESVSAIEFEGEIRGFGDLLRRLRGRPT